MVSGFKIYMYPNKVVIDEFLIYILFMMLGTTIRKACMSKRGYFVNFNKE
jgi:hypothetical protein